MPNISICFSGHPRSILNHRTAWADYFSLIRTKYDLRIFFHSWAESGLVQHDGQHYIEGNYETSRFERFDELLSFLEPQAFQISSQTDTYESELASAGALYINSWQAHPRKIMSQIQSVYLANEIRRDWEKNNTPSDAVVKMRFDLAPHHPILNEIDYITAHPDYPVLFAPSPSWHGHPGGGGGCITCHRFFHQHRLADDYFDRSHDFLKQHKLHTNDVCDLFAIGAPAVINRYCEMFPKLQQIYSSLKDELFQDVPNYKIDPLPEASAIRRIYGMSSGDFDIEYSPIFVPEKLIRVNMRDHVVVHGESIFTILRR